MAKINSNGADFQEALDLNKKEAIFVKYAKQFLIGVVALVAVVLAVFGYNTYSANKQEAASTAMASAQELFAKEQWEKANEAFLKVADQYGSTDAGNLAKLYSGLCYANLEKWEEAVKALESFSTKGDAIISPAAVEALGNAYAHLKQYDKAVSSLKKAAEMADKRSADKANLSLSPTFLLQAAQILESQGQNDEALALYKQIKEKYVASQIVGSKMIDKYIERLEQK